MDTDRIADTINDICVKERLDKEGCVFAVYYCCKAASKFATEAIRGACFNLISY